MAKSRKLLGDKKKYVVSGVTELTIEGQTFVPGDEFEATLDPVYEEQMLMGGHLQLLQDQSTAADLAQATAEGAHDVPEKAVADKAAKKSKNGE